MKQSLCFLTLLLCAAAPAADIVWTNLGGGTWNTAVNWNPNQIPTNTDTAWITNNGTYTVTVSANAAATNLVLGGTSGTQTVNHSGGTFALGNGGSSSPNGTYALSGGALTGSGTLTLGGAFNWTAGFLGSTASNLVVAANGGFNISGASGKLFNGGTLVNGGTGNWTGGAQVACAAPAIFSNSPSGTFDFQADGAAFGNNAGIPLLINSGTVRKTGGTGVSTINIVFNNAGVVDVQTGTLSLNGGGTNSGQFTSSVSGAILQFGGGTHALQSSSSITGPGSVLVTLGTVNAQGPIAIGTLTNGNSGTLNFNTGATAYLTNLTVSGGTVTASNIIVVPGAFTWTAGTIGNLGSPGILALNGSTAITGSTKNLS